MFNSIKNKLIKIWERLLGTLGGSPRVYWSWVLILYFLVLVAVFVLDGLVFWNMQSSAFGEVFLPAKIGVKSIDAQALDAAARIITERSGRFESAKNAPAMKDPS
jgi:uncharacterized membrane protein YhaH (DUF805 family)